MGHASTVFGADDCMKTTYKQNMYSFMWTASVPKVFGETMHRDGRQRLGGLVLIKSPRYVYAKHKNCS